VNNKKLIQILVPEDWYKLLKSYAETESKNVTEIMRDLIRPVIKQLKEEK